MKRKQFFSSDPFKPTFNEIFRRQYNFIQRQSFFTWLLDYHSYILYIMPLDKTLHFVQNANVLCVPFIELCPTSNISALRVRLIKLIPLIRKENRALNASDLKNLLRGDNDEIKKYGLSYINRKNEFILFH